MTNVPNLAGVQTSYGTGQRLSVRPRVESYAAITQARVISTVAVRQRGLRGLS